MLEETETLVFAESCCAFMSCCCSRVSLCPDESHFVRTFWVKFGWSWQVLKCVWYHSVAAKSKSFQPLLPTDLSLDWQAGGGVYRQVLTTLEARGAVWVHILILISEFPNHFEGSVEASTLMKPQLKQCAPQVSNYTNPDWADWTDQWLHGFIDIHDNELHLLIIQLLKVLI